MADAPLFPDLQAHAAPVAPLSQNEPPMPDLFGGSNTAGPTDSSMVNSVVSTQNSKEERVLGAAPTTSGGIEIPADPFHFGSFLFKISLFLLIATYAFFYTQMSPTFSWLGKNPVRTLAEFTASVEEEQTTINLNNLLMAKFSLDTFTSAADSFLYTQAQTQSPYTPANVKDQKLAELSTLQTTLVSSLEDAKKRLSKPLYPTALLTADMTAPELTQHYESLLKQRILLEKQNLPTADDSAARLERNLLDGALALVNNKPFQKELRAFNPETDAVKSDAIRTLFEKSTELSKDQIAVILTVKRNRVGWGSVLKELQRVTRNVDPLYRTGLNGNVDYTNVVLNATDRTVALRGETRTDDSLNFSLLSNLIDALEGSELFSDVGNRTFNKSDAQATGITSAFNLTFTLQSGEDARDIASNAVIETLHGSAPATAPATP